MNPSEPDDFPADATTYHVREAQSGKPKSLEWLVKRFSPLLLTSARYHLGKVLRELYDPEDLVNEVWLVTLPKISQLSPRDGRLTPVLLKYLSTTLTFKVNNLIEKHITGKPKKERSKDDGESNDLLNHLSADSTGIVTRVMRSERDDAVRSALEDLGGQHREIIVLRGIGQLPYKEISVLVGDNPTRLAGRYRQALQSLRKALPNSVFDEFLED